MNKSENTTTHTPTLFAAALKNQGSLAWRRKGLNLKIKVPPKPVAPKPLTDWEKHHHLYEDPEQGNVDAPVLGIKLGAK